MEKTIKIEMSCGDAIDLHNLLSHLCWLAIENDSMAVGDQDHQFAINVMNTLVNAVSETDYYILRNASS